MVTVTTERPSPAQLLGLSSGFDSFYPGQYELLEESLSWYDSPSRFLGVAAATGSGKSLSSILLAKLSGARTVIVTATKGLQMQYMRDCAQLGGVLVKGQNNFPCALVRGLRADEGPCHDGVPCPVRDQCLYRIQLRKALASQLVVTNYAYWLAQSNFSTGLGEVGLLILDEAHQAFAAMENHLTVYLARLDLQPIGLSFPSAEQWSAWRTWAGAAVPVAEEHLASVECDVRQYRTTEQSVPGHVSRTYRSAKATLAKLQRLTAVTEDWVIQRTDRGYRFVPKWVSAYTQQLLHDVPKVMLMSAILSHRSADYLGIPSDGQRSWVEMDSYFPAANTPIWHVPTARINYRTDDYGAVIWSSRIDQIIQRRLDRKGIIFTVSYDRAKLLLSRSRFKNIMFAHSKGDVVEVVEAFKAASPPAVLVSPTVTTGWDFPMGDGPPQYIVIGKLPYPDTRDPVTKARHDDDKEWSSYLAMETLVQSAGRASRSEADKSEILVVDDNWLWFYPKHKLFAPEWFRRRVCGSLKRVPDPLL